MRLENKLAAYLEYCEYRKELDKNSEAYRIDQRQYFEYVCVDEPNKEKIEEYVTYLHKSYKQKTVKRKIASVKAFYNYLEETEIIAESPLRKMKVKFKETVALPRIIPREEIEKLLSHMYQCLNESNFREDSINLNTGLIRLMGKGGKERYVQSGNNSILEVLNKYYAENEQAIKKTGYFFVNNRESRYTEQSIRIWVMAYMAIALSWL